MLWGITGSLLGVLAPEDRRGVLYSVGPNALAATVLAPLDDPTQAVLGASCFVLGCASEVLPDGFGRVGRKPCRRNSATLREVKGGLGIKVGYKMLSPLDRLRRQSDQAGVDCPSHVSLLHNARITALKHWPTCLMPRGNTV